MTTEKFKTTVITYITTFVSMLYANLLFLSMIFILVVIKARTLRYNKITKKLIYKLSKKS